MELIDDIEQLKIIVAQEKLCLLYVQAPDCGLCSIMLGKIDAVSSRFTQVRAVRVEIQVVPRVAAEFLVATAPTVLVFAQGREIYRAGNFINVAELENVLSKWCGNLT